MLENLYFVDNTADKKNYARFGSWGVEITVNHI